MVPMVELRRLLAEARTTGEPFRLVYRQRGVASGWRRVRVEYTPPSDHANGDGHLSCAVLGEWLPLPAVGVHCRGGHAALERTTILGDALAALLSVSDANERWRRGRRAYSLLVLARAGVLGVSCEGYAILGRAVDLTVRHTCGVCSLSTKVELQDIL